MSESTEPAPPADIYTFGKMKMSPARQAIIDRATANVIADRKAGRCMCPTCSHSRAVEAMKAAVEEIETATEVWLDRDCEASMSYAYLYGEVKEALALPWWKPWAQLAQIRAAFDIVQREDQRNRSS